MMLLLCALIVGGASSVWGQTYKKVTSEPTDWSGEYLIVYESSSTSGYVWSGVDANSNYKTATISSGTITKPADAVSVTIASMTGGYSIQVNGGTNNGKYISGTKDSNTTNFNAIAAANTLSYSSGVDIASNTSHFVFNSTSGTTRYRYYKSATYSGSAYKRPQLYKKAYTVTYDANGGSGTMTDANSPYFMGSTVTTKTNTFTKGGYDFVGWNTAADGNGTSYDEGDEFTLNANTTLYAQWGTASKVATPYFTVAEGTYNEVQSVELACTTPSSTIYYTTNGTDPTTGSSVYSSAIAVNATTTIKAIAVADGLDNSDIASATYTLKCTTPSITIPDGVFVSSKVVTITASDGTTIRYTTDGSTTPTTSVGTEYDPANKPSISATTTVKAIAYKDGWSDSDVASETFTKETVLDGMSALVAKTNTSDQSYYVSLTDAQVTYVNGKHGYMEDGSAGIYIYNMSPVLNKVYNGIFRVTYQLYNSMPELKAITAVEGAITDGDTKDPTEMTASDLKDNFAANLGRKIQITGHTITTTTVLITGVDFYTTYYNPSFVEGNIYTIVGYPYNNNGTLQYRVVSAVEKPEAPTFSPAAGEFATDFELTISAETGSTIYYTTNGDTPTESSTEYDPSSKPTISAGANVTVKAIAVLAGMTSDLGSVSYEYRAISRPTLDPVNGTSLYYGETIALACDVDGSTIYYTTDGSTPSTSNYTGKGTDGAASASVSMTGDVTIKAIAVKGTDESSVASASYTLKAPNAPSFDVSAGAVAYATELTISSATGTTLKYTTDDSDPSSSATATAVDANSKTIAITTAMTVKAIALDGGLNKSSETSAAYTIAAPAAPTFDVAAGTIIAGTKVTITGTGTIRYTTNGTDPTSSSGTVYSSAISIDEDCTLKAICVDGGGNTSSVKSAEYTVVTPVAGYAIDFESNLIAYTDWTMTNIKQASSTITAHGGSNYGNTDGKTSASIVTKSKVSNPGKIEFYVSRETTNSTASTWTVAVSSDGETWTQVGDAQSAVSMSKGSWEKVTRELKNNEDVYYTNVYVRVSYGSSGATRAIDDITLSLVKPVKDPKFSVSAGTYTSTQSVTLSCDTEGATIYYTTDGSEPTSSSTEYSSAISISESCTLKAIAIKGDDDSNIVSATYIILPEDGVFDFVTAGAASYDYGSGVTTTSSSSDYVTAEKTWTAKNVTCKTNGKYRWWDADKTMRFYDNTPASSLTFSVPDGYCITKIVISGGSAFSANKGSYISGTWTGLSQSVVLTQNSTSSQTITRISVTYVQVESVTVSSVGYATFASAHALDFTDSSIDAYIAEADGRTGVTFTQVYKVPANTGVLLYKAGGATEDIPVFDGTGADAVTGNVFKVGTGAAVASVDGNLHNYILNNGASGLGFYKAAGQTVATNKAYIQIDYDAVAAVKGFIALPGSEETAVEAVKADAENGVIFNLAGQRVSKLQRGINIINGKKVVVK